MPQEQYTFGPPSGVIAPPVEEKKKKQGYTFGELGKPPVQPKVGAGDGKPPAQAAPSSKWGAFAKPGPYKTKLSPDEETKFQSWVKSNKIPFENDTDTSDYDMRGFWKAQQAGDPNAKRAANLHFPDTYKTPYHETFSNESQYALPTAGHWEGDKFVPPTTPTRKLDTSHIPNTSAFHPSSFTRGAMEGAGFDPNKIVGAATIKLGDTLYPAQHPFVQQSAEMVKQATKGMGDWMNAVGEDRKHLLDPVKSMVNVLKFHTGNPRLDEVLVKDNGINEYAFDEIARGIRTRDTSVLEHGAGRLVGGLGGIFLASEAPERLGQVKTLPSSVGDVVSAAREARNKSVITAAANNVLETDAKNTIIPTITRGVRATQESIGRRFKNGADADLADNAAKGRSVTFPIRDVAQKLADTVKDTKAESVPKPGVGAVAKALNKYTPKGGLTLEDMKDVRGVIYDNLSTATGKDAAVLGKLIDYTTKEMKNRFTQLGKADAWDEYTDTTRKLNDHKNGIIKNLQNADTGLKLYQELAKESNKPQLNDMFHLLERHGGIPAGFVDDMVKTRKPLFDLAKRADAGDAAGGRMGAILRHPYAAGTAMIGTGAALSTFSPIPLTGSFVASLVAAQKVANFMDRYDAARALQDIRRAPSGAPSPVRPITPPASASSPGGPPSPTAPPSGGAAPVSAPTAPSAPRGPASPPVAPVGVGAPKAPASLDELMSRISKAQEAQAPKVEPSVEVDYDKLADKMVEKGQDPGFAAQRARQIANILKEPTKYTPSEVAQAKNARAMWEGPERRVSQQTVETERRGAGAAAQPTAESTPYSQFGVKIDKSKLTTPEAVRAAKLDATHQIEEIARNKYKMLSGISDLTERQAALKKLEKETTAAKRSVDKLQTPGVSRGARDRLRKAEQASAVKPMEREGLEHLSPEEVTQKAAKGVTNDEAAMIEMIDLAREAEAAGPTVKTVFDKIYAKSGGNDAAALPTLRALMEQVRKAKKPAAD